uniref:Uncharacterized protein n=1 Tax=Panagrolaimus sp. ES5 TaxID=591445 RepID=A0AC34FAB2_9BILA
MSTGIVMAQTSLKKSSAKRCLFGKSSSSTSDSFCSRLLEEINSKKCQEWEFDFANVIFQRQPRFGSKKATSKPSRKQSRTLASPNDGKLTSHMPLHVSKRIVKKSAASKTSSSISSSAVNFIFNEISAAGTTGRSTTSNHQD